MDKEIENIRQKKKKFFLKINNHDIISPKWKINGTTKNDQIFLNHIQNRKTLNKRN